MLFCNDFLNVDNFYIIDQKKLIHYVNCLPESFLDLVWLCFAEVISGKKLFLKSISSFPVPSTQIQN